MASALGLCGLFWGMMMTTMMTWHFHDLLRELPCRDITVCVGHDANGDRLLLMMMMMMHTRTTHNNTNTGEEPRINECR